MQALLGLVRDLIRLLPTPLARGLGRFLGRGLWLFQPRMRRLVRRQMAAAFALDERDPRLDSLVLRNFRHYGFTAVEFLRMRNLIGPNRQLRLRYRGMRHFRAALRAGNGVIALTAHLGNFALLAAINAQLGLPVTIVVKRMKRDRWLERFWVGELEYAGIGVLYNRDSMMEIMRVLRRNEVLGFIADQHDSRSGVRAPFFHAEASTFRAPATMVQRSGVPIVPGFAWRTPSGGHVVEIDAPIPFERAEDSEREIVVNTARYNRVIEAAVRRHPEQWLWIHRRWK